MTKELVIDRVVESVSLFAARRWSHKRRVLDVDIYVWREDGLDPDGLFEKVERGLRLLQEVDPVRYRRFNTVFSSVYVVPTVKGSAALANGRRRLCMVNPDWLSDSRVDGVRVASALAHEGTHGHLEASGVPYREDLRGRIEGVCLSAEAAFLRKLPEWPAEVGKRVYAQRSIASAYYEDDSFHKRRYETLEDLGLSPRALRFMKWMDGFRTGRNGT